MLLPDEKIAVEYDGSFWHLNSLDHDTRKTLDLLERGYKLVRIRERSSQFTLSSLNIKDPRYLELTYNYSPTWEGLSEVADQITSWITDLTPTT